jgi:outer membrane immunogenic protein
MLRRTLLASAGAMALTGAALAADLPTQAPPPVFLPPPPVFTWTGLYIGGQLGYKWGNDNANVNEFFAGGAFPGVPPFPAVTDIVPLDSNPNGAIGGAHIGYNWQIAQWVFGVEADVDSTNYHGNAFGLNSDLAGFFGTAVRDNIRSNIEGSFRGRVGWAWDRLLLYGTGGIAFADVTNDYGESFCFAGGCSGLNFDSRTRTLVGWTAGGGIEYAVIPNWLIGVEYRYTDFGRFTDTGLFGIANPGVPFGAEFDAHHHLTQNRVQARVSYKFDWFNPGPVVAKY